MLLRASHPSYGEFSDSDEALRGKGRLPEDVGRVWLPPLNLAFLGDSGQVDANRILRVFAENLEHCCPCVGCV